MIFAIVVQTVGVIFWVSQLSSKIDQALTTMTEFKAERYTREDARRDRELLDQKFSASILRDNELDRRLNSIESRLDRIDGRAATAR